MRHADFIAPTRRFLLSESSTMLKPRQLLLICFGVSVLLAISAPASGATLIPTVTSLTATQGNVGTTAVTFVSQVSTASGSAVTAGTVVFCDTSVASCVGAPGAIATAQLVQTTTGSWTATAKVAVSVGSHSYKAVFQGTSLYQASSSTKQTINVAGKSYTFLANSLTPGSPGNYNWQGMLYGFGSSAPTGTLSLLDSTDGNLLLGSAALPSAFSPGFLVSNGSPISTGTHPVSIAVADFNGDGFPDLAVANESGSVSILIGNHDGTFSATPASPITVSGGAESIVVGDFFNDGIQDIAVAGTSGQLTILQGDGGGNFGTWGSLSIGPVNGPYAVTVGDFNQDGNLDIAIANSSSGNVLVLLNKGGFSGFTSSSTAKFGSEPSAVAIADFNGDGIPDLAVTDAFKNNVTILYGDGTGSFAVGPSLPVGINPNQVLVVDLNGDGRPDLIITNLGPYPADGAPPTVLLANGPGSFTPYSSSTLQFPSSIAIADLNADGIPDVVWASVGSGGFALGNGDGSFNNYLPSAGVIDTNTKPFVAVADFNGDGRPDTASTNYSGSGIYVGLSEIGAQTNAILISVPIGGPQSVVASYSGDSNYSGSQSSPYIFPCSFATAPTFSPDPGTYSSPQFVTLADSTPGATIYYTTNGVTPSSSSAAYSGPVYVPSTVTIEAVATAPGCASSGVQQRIYTISIPPIQPPPPANLGTVNVGTVGPVSTLTFTFNASETLGSIAVLTQGATGLDFTDAGTGSCTAGTNYLAGATCTVNVSFTPKFAGARYGAVVLDDKSGNMIATGYVIGNGLGPQLNFLPGTQNAVVSVGLTYPYGVAVDGFGNVYITDSGNNRVLKETWSAGNYIQSTVPTSGLNGPEAVAVDGAGNIYIGDATGLVLKETLLGGGAYAQSTLANSSLGSIPLYPLGITVDGSGNVYIANENGGEVLKETLSGGSYVQSTIASGLGPPNGVAVDASGNVYVIDRHDGTVLKETLSTGSYTESTIDSGLGAPEGVAVDGFGNVYIADTNNRRVLKETLTGGGYVRSTITSGLYSNPLGVTVDGRGNVYIVTSNDGVFKEDFADPPNVSFATTSVGSASVDSPQMVTVENIGNAALSFPIPSAGKNPGISTNFTLNSSGASACPLLSTTSSTAGTLAAGASCLLPISFIPSTVANLSGSLTMTDNALNAIVPYATQSITLSGTGSQATPAITWATPAAITYGTALSATQLDASSTVAGTFVYTPTAGTVLGAGTQTLSVTLTPTDKTDYTTATDTVQLIVNKGTPTVMVSPSATKIFTVQSLSVTVAVSGGNGNVTATGSVTLTGGGYTSAAATLNTGSATISIPAGSLAIGTDMLTANYTPDTASSSTYNVASGSNSVTVNLLGTGTATITATPSATTITNQQTVNVAVSVAGSGSATPSGIVTLASSGYSAQQTLTSGAASFSIPAGALSSGADTLTAAYSGDGTYGVASGTTTVTVSPVVVTVAAPSPVSPGGTATANAVLAAGSTYSGTMALTCSLTGAPSGAQSLPTCSLNPASVTIASGGGETTVLTVKTTAATVGALMWPSRLNPWAIGGGEAVMAGLLMLGLPLRRRKMSMLVLLMAILVSGATGCSGGGGGNSSTSTPSIPATTAGSYTFTVTGTDSANSKITTSTNVTITVQ
jgi:sugar lactone lactonase YvrE